MAGNTGSVFEVAEEEGMKKHFVTFLSPGTFTSERLTKEIDSWSVSTAVRMSKDVTERYGATPYGFYFTTRERGPEDLDSKVIETSPTHYLDGKVLTLQEVEDLNDSSHTILIQNMRRNKWDKVVMTNNSYSWVQPLEEDDVVLKTKDYL